MVRNLNVKGAGLGAYVYLKRGDSFELDIAFEYKGSRMVARICSCT